jgi:hypothetical protein
MFQTSDLSWQNLLSVSRTPIQYIHLSSLLPRLHSPFTSHPSVRPSIHPSLCFTQVDDHPGHYDAHHALIAALRAAGHFDALQHARERMRARFPLHEAIWREWVADQVRRGF